MIVVQALVSWALFAYLVRAAWPRIRTDASRVRSWLGLSVRRTSSLERADRAKPGSTAEPDPAAVELADTAPDQPADLARTALARARAVARKAR